MVKEIGDIALTINHYLDKKKEFDKAKADFDKVKKDLNNYLVPIMKEEDTKSIEISGTKVTLVERKTDSFDIVALEQVLDEDTKKEVLEKKYVVADWDKLVSTFTKFKVRAKEITPNIIVEKTVDTKVLKNKIELGEITQEQYNQFVTQKVTSSYLKVTPKKV